MDLDCVFNLKAGVGNANGSFENNYFLDFMIHNSKIHNFMKIWVDSYARGVLTYKTCESLVIRYECQ